MAIKQNESALVQSKKTYWLPNIPHFLAKQACHPKGLFGRLFGKAMNKMNKESNQWVLTMLNLNTNDKVLEVGYGPGDGINRLSQIVTDGFIPGIDYSETMYHSAKSKNKQAIERGLVELSVGDAEKLPYESNFFDSMFCVHVLYFWQDPISVLKELIRTLKPAGKIALFIGDKEEMSGIKLTQTGVYNLYTLEEIVELLEESGFINVHYFQKCMSTGPLSQGICIVGEKAPC